MKNKTIFRKIAVILSGVFGAGIGIILGKKFTKCPKSSDKEYAEKHLAILQLFNQWMITKQEGKSVVDYLQQNDIKTVAIYGMSYVGERLYDELKGSAVEVKYGIDKNADGIYAEMPMITPDEKMEDVDMIIVTAVYFYDEIVHALREKTNNKIVSLEDILYEM